MKKEKIVPLLIFLLVFFNSCQERVKSNLTLLNNQIPRDSAMIFGPDIISTQNFEFAITFSPQMNELYFTRRKPGETNKIYGMRVVHGEWTEPELAFFSSEEGWDFEPHISPKGDLLYFGSTRPLNDTTESSGMHQWYLKKNADGWQKPLSLKEPFEDRIIMYLTSSENGNLYFTSGEKGDKPEDWVIYNSIREEGQYRSVKKMGSEVNFSGKWIAHSYIAPDESYIIYDGERSSGYGDCDLYISFNKDGSWTQAYNLGPEVNTDQCEMCPSVSPDGKYLFFHRGTTAEGEEDEGNIYWIDFNRLKKRIEGKSIN